jgi:osmotically-inducible protein OsmY
LIGEDVMAKSNALLILPAGKHAAANKDAVQTTAELLQRSLQDLHLAERVERALHGTGYRSLRDIEISVQARLVTLRGRVPSYYLKQLAQTIALAVPGTKQVRNSLEVLS